MILGCSAEGTVDNGANNVILIVELVQLESDPFGDVLTSGGTILDDVALFDMAAVLKAPISTSPNTLRPDLQNVALERYEVTFTRTDGGTLLPPGFTRGISGLVRLSEPGSEAALVTPLSIIVVPSTIKAQPPISFLISPGSEEGTNFINIQVNARIQFFGRTLAGDEVTVVANIGINFANYGDDNS
jgi:hypothetical protein